MIEIFLKVFLAKKPILVQPAPEKGLADPREKQNSQSHRQWKPHLIFQSFICWIAVKCNRIASGSSAGSIRFFSGAFTARLVTEELGVPPEEI